MDKEELQKKIGLYYQDLPPKAQALFSSMKWLDILQEISVKYNLTEEQTKSLGSNTTLVLLSVIHPEEYETLIKKELSLSESVFQEILKEIKSKILDSVAGDLEKNYLLNLEDIAIEKGIDFNDDKKNNITETLDERILKLPVEIKKVIDEANYQSKLYNIAKFYNLNVAQMATLEKATTDLILGVINTERFEDYIESHLGLDEEKNRGLVNDINEEIFKKIREKILLLNEDKHAEKVFGSAGIEILSDAKTPTTPKINKVEPVKIDMKKEVPASIKENLIEIPAPHTETKPVIPAPEVVKIETTKADTHPILAGKLSGLVQNKSTTTEHTLENIGKNSTNIQTKPKISNIDPYRELPE